MNRTLKPEILTPDWSGPDGSPQLYEAGELIYESNWKFYDLFSASIPAIIRNIGIQLRDPFNELSSSKVSMGEGSVLGVYCFYGTEDTRWRQIGSLRLLLDIEEPRPDAMVSLERFAEQIEPVIEPSMYLSRIAVRGDRRGEGIGRVLIEDFEQEARAQGYGQVSLHVMRDNDPAIRFYKKGGYETVSSPDIQFLTMLKRF